MKTCNTCGEIKPAEDFHKCSRMKDGRKSDCKECRNADSRKYKASLGESLRAKKRQYYVDNRHIKWGAYYRRKSRVYGFDPTYEPFTAADLIDRYGDKCFHCGGPFEQLDHHPIPLAQGGAHNLDNCKPSCGRCNLSLGAVLRRGGEWR